MTPREIIYANLNHSGAPRPGMTFGDGFRMSDIVEIQVSTPEGYAQKRYVDGNFEYYDDMWGNLWKRMVDGCKGGEIDRPVLPDWSGIDSFQAPKFEVDKVAALYRNAFANREHLFRVATMPHWIFSASRYIRQMDNYFLDMAIYPEELHRLHAEVATVYRTMIIAAGKAGADAIFLYEDMGTQTDILFSPEMWDEYFKDLYTELFDLAHENGMRVFMHSCGQNSKILERLLAAGVNAFQFDQPTVYDWDNFLIPLFKKYRATLWSPVDIQKIMPTGDRKIIEQGAVDMFNAFNGFLICKNYGDLPGIGVELEWDNWWYAKILELSLKQQTDKL